MSSICVKQLTKTFGHRRALDALSLNIEAGEMVALIGASGSGKSTLLRHIAGLAVGDAGTQGLVQLDGRRVQNGGRLASDVRELRANMGFVFQQFNLVGRMPVVTNVLAGMLHRVPPWRSTFRYFLESEIRLGIAALERVGIGDLAWQRASTLSGGQQQRAAIARTLVQGATVILADEPIASLDPESSRRVMQILAAINREDGATVVVSLHQVQVAVRYCPRTIALHQGRVVYDGASRGLTHHRLREIYGEEVEALLQPDSRWHGSAPARATDIDVPPVERFAAAAAI